MMDDINFRISSKRAELFYKNGLSANLTVIFVALMVFVLMRGFVSPPLLISWLITILSLALIRFGLITWRNRSIKSHSPEGWLNIYTFFTILVSFAWVWIIVIGFVDNAWLRMMIVVLVVGLTALSMSVLVSHPVALYWYVIPPNLTITSLLIYEGGLGNILLSVAIVMYMLGILSASSNYYQVLINGLRVGFENEDLARELKVTAETAESGSLAKSQFLASMSHELRTPLNAVIGYSELLQEEAEELDQKAFIPDLKKINSAGKHLLDLINDILDLSKIEAGKIELHNEPVDIRELIRDIVSTVQPMIEKNGNRLLRKIGEGIGGMHTDQTRLRQVLFNLLSNAAKFTQAGKITLEVKREVIDNDEHMVFQVRDTGIGMSEEQQARIFDTFTQADSKVAKHYGGTGLGLSISRQLCQLMGGSLNVESTPGIGSKFTIWLPITNAANDINEQTFNFRMKRIA